MRLNMFKRKMIFPTFFGSCICITLIVGSLVTPYWIEARARRASNPLKSEGRINFGLFEGYKDLNVGYGWRKHHFSVTAGTHPARRWAWCGTVVQLGVSIAAAFAACFLAAFGSASVRCLSRPLLVCNCAAVLFCLGAIAVWLTEYFLRLQHNVMSEEDLTNTWSSDGMADLGPSFWLIVGAAISSFINIICILLAMADNNEPDAIAPELEEKVNGAIMLY